MLARCAWVALSLWIVACGSEPPTGAPDSVTTPRPGGMGRVPDLPAVRCATTRASSPPPPDAPPGCRTDAECTEGRNPRCIRFTNRSGRGPSLDTTMCTHDACFEDADCGPREMCACDPRAEGEVGGGHVCASGECAQDADCGTGRYCRRGPSGRYCHALADECVEETDCGEGRICSAGRDGVWRCVAWVPPVG